MFSPLHVTISPYGIYHLRFPIPQNIHPERIQSYVKVSLGTRCPKEALHLARGLCYGGEHIIQEARTRRMNYDQIRDFLTFFFKERLASGRQRIAEQGRLTDDHKQALYHAEDFCKDALETKSYTLEGTDAQLTGIIEKYELPIEMGTKQYEMFRTEFLTARIEYARRMLDIDSGYGGYDLSDNEVKYVKPAVPSKKGLTLGEAVKQYKAEKLRLKEWTDSSLLDYQGKFDLLVEYLGAETNVDIASEVAWDVKNMLLRMPKFRKNKPELKDKPVAVLIEMEGYKRLSASTVNQYLVAYSGFYEWLLNRDRVTKNPFKKTLDKVAKTKIKRDPFTQSQIDLIIPIVMGASKPHHKWGSLIAFYTGARLNEIAQLERTDIIDIDGITCFNFTDEGGEGYDGEGEDDAPKGKKKLKNESSKRAVPIHPKLRELGFFNYLRAQQELSSPNKRLFAGLTLDKKNGHGRNLGRWFNDSVLDKKLGIKSEKLVFHCIRHTVASRLRNAKIGEADIANILGHSQKTVTTGTYARNLDKVLMLEAIETLDYGAVAALPEPTEEVDPLTLP